MSADARADGRTCAVAGQAQRQMSAWAAEYPGLYKADAFDPALHSTLALAMAFSGPWLDAEGLRMANRATLWSFGLDWIMDYAARSRDEVEGVRAGLLRVAAGEPPQPGDDLSRFLADIRAELAAAPAFAGLEGVWREELDLMLEGMVLEWRWKDEGHRPDFAEYLANADNLGFSFVFATHWIARGGDGDPDAVREASRAVQRVIRLLNDLGTVERDRKWGDLNALLLGVGREEVEARISELAAEAEELLAPLPYEHAEYMRRQMSFCSGFYGVTDFWGAA